MVQRRYYMHKYYQNNAMSSKVPRKERIGRYVILGTLTIIPLIHCIFNIFENYSMGLSNKIRLLGGIGIICIIILFQ